MDPTKEDKSTTASSGPPTSTPTTSWLKGERRNLSPNFSSREFDCQCKYPDCTTQKINIELVHKLEMMRGELHTGIKITSGFRCAKHQRNLGAAGAETAKGLSQHELGEAADIVSSKMIEMAALANYYFDAVGVSPRFVHVDMRSDKKRHWTYLK